MIDTVCNEDIYEEIEKATKIKKKVTIKKILSEEIVSPKKKLNIDLKNFHLIKYNSQNNK